ncbi:MAG: hypothetical protein WC792_00750 [Candidatus Micrarchaeia archaeon]
MAFLFKNRERGGVGLKGNTRWLQRLVTRPLNEEERRVAAREYGLAVSVFGRSNLHEDVPPQTREKLVEGLLSKSRVVRHPFLYHRMPFDRAALAATVPLNALALSSGNPKLAGASAAISAAAAGGFVGLRLWKTRLVVARRHKKGGKYPLEYRKASAKYPGSYLHEAIHALDSHFARHHFGEFRHRHNVLASAADELYTRSIGTNHLRSPLAPEKSFPPERVQLDSPRENHQAGWILGRHAYNLGRRLGSPQAAWDYLWLLSWGASHVGADMQIRHNFYAKKPGAPSAKAQAAKNRK